MSRLAFPPFEPHRLLRGAHAQTLAGVYLPGPRLSYRATRHCVTLDDGDQIVLHEDRPLHGGPTNRSALLIHGLAGTHASGYMQRIAHKLNVRGVSTFRMDLRGCGAGAGLARLPYHSGRSEDAAAALRAIARLLPQSVTTLIGFSLGANITLKLLGELGNGRCGNLESAVAVSPPVDLAACSRQIQRRGNRIYDRHFVALLMRQLEMQHRRQADAVDVKFVRRPETLWEFDDKFTAVVSGFGTAENYYRMASSAQWIPAIRLPTLIVASRDDPMIPCDGLEQVKTPPSVHVCLTERGGHLGFVGRRGIDDDCRWMDWRVVDWVMARNGAVAADAAQNVGEFPNSATQ